MVIGNFFKNKFLQKEGVNIYDNDDKYTENFSKQWRDFSLTQVDSFNKTKISEDYLNELMFNKTENLNNKKVLEIGCGSGRFTEHIIKKSKLCVAVDLSKSIFYNVAKNNKNLILIKSDFLNLEVIEKFDIVICRGVLQHTPIPNNSILKLFDFVKNDGLVYFDYYKKPKLGILHPKYFFWRPILRSIFSYNEFKVFLEKNISKIILFKNLLRKITFNSNFISDAIFPIWDFRERKYNISKELFENWTILDTLDGIFAKYDYPKSNIEIIDLLKKNNIKIINNNQKKNFICGKLIKENI